MGLRLTKTDMARVVVTALYNLPELANEDDARVWKLVRRSTVDQLTRRHKLAMSVIEQRLATSP